jgi:hypothetical protein
MSLNLNINGTITTGQSTQSLLYVCRNKYVSQVPSVAGADTPYYYVFDLQHFVDMVNTTLKSILVFGLQTNFKLLQKISESNKCIKLKFNII